MSVQNMNPFSKYILEHLYADLKNDALVQEWFIRIITIQVLITKKMISGSFSIQKSNNLELCKSENVLFPDIFEENISLLEKNYPSHFFEPPMIETIKSYFETDFEMDNLGMLQEDLRSFERLHHFTSTNRNSDLSVDKSNITAITQIFTPLMISKYMVNNTIYQQEGISDLNKNIKNKQITEDFSIVDPCLGTGNILLVAFDKLVKYYENHTKYTKEEIIRRVFKNLYGFDIDKTAILLAKFIFHLKAFTYCPTYLQIMNEITIQFYHIKESNEEQLPKELCLQQLVNAFQDASLKGSLIQVNHLDLNHIEKIIGQYPKLKYYFLIAKLLAKKYDVVLTNPPYMGRKVLPKIITNYLNQEYPYGKSELYTAFMERCLSFLKPGGLLSMITLHTWMFIKSFSHLRKWVISNYQIHSVLHLGKNTFENLNAYNALACAFVIENTIPFQDTCFVKLTDYDTLSKKEQEAENRENYYYVNQQKFLQLTNSPFVYWISNHAYDLLLHQTKLGSICEIRQGLATGNNKKFIRMWHEVPLNEIGFHEPDRKHFLASGKKYAPYNKGGNQIKWYTTSKVVIRFDKESYDILKQQGNHLPSRDFYFKQGITWSLFGFNSFNVRYKEIGYVFDVSGSSLFTDNENLKYLLAFLSSSVAYYFLSILAPTVNFQVGNIASLPIIMDKNKKRCIEKIIDELLDDAIYLDKEEEASWNFCMPLLFKLDIKQTIEERMNIYILILEDKEKRIQKNEQRINELFEEIYQMNVPSNTIQKHEKKSKKEIAQLLLSYIVGVIFGRFQLENYQSPIDNRKWIELDMLYKEIQQVFRQYNIDESIICMYLKQNIVAFLKKPFFEYHLKIYDMLPLYWYRLKENKVYVGYYHTLQEEVNIDFDKGIYENYQKNKPLLYKLK